MRVLVPQALTLMQPQKGEAKLINQILLAMLGAEQFTFLKEWIQLGYNCLKNYDPVAGQVLIMAGPIGCGKNLVQELIITPILGVRMAEPYRYAVGRTQFNQDLFKATHLMIADQKNPRDRVDMREFIRRVASNHFDSLHLRARKQSGFLPSGE